MLGVQDYDDSQSQAAQTVYTPRGGGGGEHEKKKKYPVRVEIRSSNQEILELLRGDFESVIAEDLS